MQEVRDSLLEEFCVQRPRLLRAEVAIARARLSGAPLLDEVALSFDAGVLRLRPVAETNEIQCVVSPDQLSSQLIDYAEEEPWWRVLGNPLIAASASPGSEAGSPELTLQFREEASNPRFISLYRLSGGLGVRCETLDQMKKRLAQRSET